MNIGLLSDTHGYLDPKLFKIFENVDEIWHAGDIGNLRTVVELSSFKPLKAVFGNIDGTDIRLKYPASLRFTCNKVDVLITHIGGYPGKYSKPVSNILRSNPPDLMISGHSHIAKVMYDHSNRLLYINPGAAGKVGLHTIRTVVRFTIIDDQIKDLEVIELGNKKIP